MKRTTIILPDDLHDELRREAFQARISMAELIRGRIRRKPQARPKGKAADPLRQIEGILHDGTLNANLDEELCG